MLSVVLLWWALHDVSAAAVVRELRTARLLPFLAAVAIATATFPLRTIRWRYLLRYEGAPLPFRPLWHATAIGFMANNLLPARAGELARAYAVRRLTGVRFTTALASIAVERVFDGLTIVTLMLLAIAAGGFAPDTTIAGMGLTRVATIAAVFFGSVFVVLLVIVRQPVRSRAVAHRLIGAVLPARLAERGGTIFDGFVAGLDALQAPGRLAIVVGWSMVIWLVAAASFAVGFAAFGIRAPLSGALLLQTVISLGVTLPTSPGFFGLFEAATKVTLGLYGIVADSALSFAIGYHIATFIPITLLGFWSLWRTKMHFADLTTPPPAVGPSPADAA